MESSDNNSQDRRVGRKPLEITPAIIQKAEKLASLGMNKVQIAQALGMGESTLYEKMDAYPEFADAIKAGKAKGIALVTNKLIEKMERSQFDKDDPKSLQALRRSLSGYPAEFVDAVIAAGHAYEAQLQGTQTLGEATGILLMGNVVSTPMGGMPPWAKHYMPQK